MSLVPEATNPISTGPIRDDERAIVLDVLRGVALLGILVINIQIFAQPDQSFGFGEHDLTVDRLVLLLISCFIQAKFYSLFSFLYGVGFAVQMRNANEGDSRATRRFFRRSAALAMFGILHIVLVWDGDILLAYALTGLLLPLYRNVSDKALKRWIVCLISIPFLLALLAFILVFLFRLIPSVDTSLHETEAQILKGIQEQTAAEIEKLQTSTYLTAMRRRVLHYLLFYTFGLGISVPAFLGMFLTGLLVGRRRIPMQLSEHRPLLRKAAMICLSIGLPVALFTSITALIAPLLTAVPTQFFNNYFAGPILGLGYAAVMALIVCRWPSATWLKPIAATGRMGFTKYLMQSVVCTTFFAGYGLGQAGKFGPLQLVGLALALYAIQLVLSTIWLRYFEFGPMEWLWRTLTYGKFPPFLRRENPVVPLQAT
ncbi:MAG: DUF418 domain-containing protein [Gemmataceae bacterium]